jgi:hypothetical protein
MSTARILVLMAALGAGGVAAHPEQSETRGPARQSSTPTLALRSIAGVNTVENGSDNQAPKRGGSISVVRYGVSGSTTTQKLQGRTI